MLQSDTETIRRSLWMRETLQKCKQKFCCTFFLLTM